MAIWVTQTFFSRTCRILFSNFSRTWIRDALGAVPCYNWQKDHVPMPAWLTEGQRDYVRLLPKSQQLNTDWAAHFSVGGRLPARIFGPGCTEDYNSWSKLIAIVLICAWHILICVSLNPRCLVELMRRISSCPVIQTILHRRLTGASVGLSAFHLVVKVRSPYHLQWRR